MISRGQNPLGKKRAGRGEQESVEAETYLRNFLFRRRVGFGIIFPYEACRAHSDASP
jgi:hypothetical protein